MVWKQKWSTPTHDESKPSRPALPEYSQWATMRDRCKVGGRQQRLYQNYVGCTYDPAWESYDVYIEWARQQVGFMNRTETGKIWQLDKDLLSKGNKQYGQQFCVFVPPIINAFLILRKRDRGPLPIGVAMNRNYIMAQVNYEGKCLRLGYFPTVLKAFEAYKEKKESIAKELAVRHQGLVDERVIQALNNYSVSITD